jgi:hypothetical protein
LLLDHFAQLSLKTADKFERQVVFGLLAALGKLPRGLFQISLRLLQMLAGARRSILARLTIVEEISRALRALAGVLGLQSLKLSGELVDIGAQGLLPVMKLPKLALIRRARRRLFRLSDFMSQLAKLLAQFGQAPFGVTQLIDQLLRPPLLLAAKDI